MTWLRINTTHCHGSLLLSMEAKLSAAPISYVTPPTSHPPNFVNSSFDFQSQTNALPLAVVDPQQSPNLQWGGGHCCLSPLPSHISDTAALTSCCNIRHHTLTRRREQRAITEEDIEATKIQMQRQWHHNHISKPYRVFTHE